MTATELKATIAHEPPHHITELEAKHKKWRVWTADKGSPMATRRGNAKCPKDVAGWALTLFCGSWNELAKALTEQDAIDERAELDGARSDG